LKNLAMSANHYENFPVGPLLLPTQFQLFACSTRRFVGTGDDFADGDELLTIEVLQRPEQYRTKLPGVRRKRSPATPLFVVLNTAVRPHQVPPQRFIDLFDACSRDIATRQWALDKSEWRATAPANPAGKREFERRGASVVYIQT
jgi:hypothetical protein